MAGAMRKVAVYLGLAEDGYRDGYGDGYDDYADYDEMADGHDESMRSSEPARGGTVSTLAPAVAASAPVAADLSKITALMPKTYNEARNIGENFRDGIPVIMNLGDMDPDDAKRLVDFAAGLTFGLRGTLERISSKVFLLSPQSVKVTTEEKQRLAKGDLYNQS